MILPLEQQVTSLDLSQELERLGVNQEGYFKWRCRDDNEPHLLTDHEISEYGGPGDEYFQAYSVVELAAMIPRKAKMPQSTTLGRWYRMAELNIHRSESGQAWIVAFIQPNSRDVFKSFGDVNIAEAMGEMLVWLLTNELIPRS